MQVLKRNLVAKDVAKLIGVTARTVRKARQGQSAALSRVRDALDGKTIPDTVELELKRARQLKVQDARNELWASVTAFTKALEFGDRRTVMLARDRFHKARKVSTELGIWFKVPASLKDALANEKKEPVTGADLLNLGRNIVRTGANDELVKNAG